MYQALYRKWRPRTFDDVVGQSHITDTLKQQVAGGRLSHAYLFTGTRGTGKTTCAKIFAKAVNCLHPQNGDPCGECEICRGIDNGSILDVVEMDAASNNGVDDIRDLRDETAYTPSACKYKVYIIDEVHMLSTAAFNALLKTLEEPPAHVIFIPVSYTHLTLPTTILSRCQRYDFTRIGPEDIARRVEYIAGEEKLELSPKAPLKSLSKGNKEKVQLILAMSRNARLYLLDEPIGGVDPAARDYILNTILTNYSRDASVIISTHLIEDVEPVLDEAVFLKNGRIFAHRSVDELRETEGMSVDAYFREVFKC